MVCRVAIVDDNEDMRFLASAFLEAPDIEIVGTAVDGRGAVALVREHAPHVLLLDLVLERESGLDVAEQVLHLRPDTAILLFSEFLDAGVERRAAELGIRACVQKDHFHRLPDVIREHCPSP